MIKPTVGRKVWYRPSKADLTGPVPMSLQGNPSYNPQPLDATILAVWGDRIVNVLVLDIVGKPFTKTSVMLIQEGDQTPKDVDGNEAYGYVEWMPYQNAQAKGQELIASLPSLTITGTPDKMNIPMPDGSAFVVTKVESDTSGLPG